MSLNTIKKDLVNTGMTKEAHKINTIIAQEDKTSGWKKFTRNREFRIEIKNINDADNLFSSLKPAIASAKRHNKIEFATIFTWIYKLELNEHTLVDRVTLARYLSSKVEEFLTELEDDLPKEEFDDILETLSLNFHPR